MAREAGKMAALDIINSNPKVFDAYKPFPVILNCIRTLCVLMYEYLFILGFNDCRQE